MNDHPIPNFETKQKKPSVLSTSFKQGASSGFTTALLCSMPLAIIGLVYIFDWDIGDIPRILFAISIIKVIFLSLIIAMPICGLIGLVMGWISKSQKASKISGIVTGIVLTPFITSLSLPLFYF